MTTTHRTVKHAAMCIEKLIELIDEEEADEELKAFLDASAFARLRLLEWAREQAKATARLDELRRRGITIDDAGNVRIDMTLNWRP